MMIKYLRTILSAAVLSAAVLSAAVAAGLLVGCASTPGEERDPEATANRYEDTIPDDTAMPDGTSAESEDSPSGSDADASDADASDADASDADASDADVEDAVEALLAGMTLREKVGQLFLIRVDSLDSSQTPAQVNDAYAAGATELTGKMRETLREYPAGGVVLFFKNIADAEQLTEFLADLQSAASIPLLTATDEEGGLVSRLANHPAFELPQYESAAAVGANGDSEDARKMGETIGAYLREYGFNMDFAPVADVNTNPDNPVIGTRAFSSDAETVAVMANAMASGLKSQGIIPVFKHFPGHGDTAEDSHSGIAVNGKTKTELAACEWTPYRTLTPADCVMVGHIAVPDVTGDFTPATTSFEIVSGILRGELGFDGVTITDSLSMGAITDAYTSGEAALKAIEAGCDLLLMPENFTEAFDAVLAAAESGELSVERIEESARRILTLKKAYGLF